MRKYILILIALLFYLPVVSQNFEYKSIRNISYKEQRKQVDDISQKTGLVEKTVTFNDGTQNKKTIDTNNGNYAASKIPKEYLDGGDGFKDDIYEILDTLESKLGFKGIQNNYFKTLSKKNSSYLASMMISYLEILGYICLLIILLGDLSTFNMKSKDEGKRLLEPTKLLKKYLVVLTVTFFPNIYCALAEIPYNVLNAPLEFLLDGNEEDASRDLNYTKVYDDVVGLIYTGGFDIIGDGNEDIKVNSQGKTIKINNASYNKFVDQIWIKIYFNLYKALTDVKDIVYFVLIGLSKFLIYLCILLFPIAMLLEFIPGFQGGVLPVVKYIVNFSLWGIISKTIAGMFVNMNQFSFAMNKSVYELSKYMELSASNQSRIDYAYSLMNMIENQATLGNLFIEIMLILILIITPKISDIIISGSQSGAFFSTVTGMATTGMYRTMKLSGDLSKKGLKEIKKTPEKTTSIYNKAKDIAGKIRKNLAGGDYN